MGGSTYAPGARALRGRHARSSARPSALAAACDYLQRDRPGPHHGARAGADRAAARRAPRACAASSVIGPDSTRVARLGGVLRDRRRAPARRRPVARRARHRRARRSPLRRAGLPPLRRPGHDAGVVLPLQHRGRDRRAAGRHHDRPAVLEVHDDDASTESMYQEIILDHYRHPHHKGLRDPYDVEVHHVNPTCGDEVTLRVRGRRRRRRRTCPTTGRAARSARPARP